MFCLNGRISRSSRESRKAGACTQKNTCRKGNSGLLNHSFLHLGGLLRQNDLATTILNFNGCAEISRELF